MSNLKDLVHRLLTQGPHRVSPTSRRVRALFNGQYVADTTAAKHVWEIPYYPQYYLPFDALKKESWTKQEDIKDENGDVAAMILKIRVKGSSGEKQTDRVVGFRESPSAGELGGSVRIEFCAMDQWFEEDTPIYVHPKDPFHRIEILSSSRPVKIELDGHTVATSPSSSHLLETNLPTRYYLPPTCIDPAILRPSPLTTKCPYKGEAEYYHVVLGEKTYENIIWYYRHPTSESAVIAGLLCFYNEKADIWLDGVKLARPKTPFS